jgi:hypothetical protein
VTGVSHHSDGPLQDSMESRSGYKWASKKLGVFVSTSRLVVTIADEKGVFCPLSAALVICQ